MFQDSTNVFRDEKTTGGNSLERSFSRLPVTVPLTVLTFAAVDGSGLEILAKARAAVPWAEIYPYDRTILSPIAGQVTKLAPRVVVIVPYSVPGTDGAENSVVLWSDLLSTAIDMIPWTKAEITSGKIRGYEGYKLREQYKKYPNLEANNPISWIYP